MENNKTIIKGEKGLRKSDVYGLFNLDNEIDFENYRIINPENTMKEKKRKSKIVLIIFLLVLSILSFKAINYLKDSNFSFSRYINKDKISSYKEYNYKNIKSKINFLETDISKINISNELILVNNKNRFNEKIENELIKYDSTSNQKNNLLNKRIIEPFEEMKRDCESETSDKLIINSGFRDVDRQNEIYKNSKNKNLVQKAGYSEHHTGLAIDLSGKTNNDKVIDFLENNSYKYGFIRRYPKDKVDITNINYENWHYRYVGLVHSTIMYNKNQCFEEYLDMFKNTNLYVEINDKKYYIYLERLENNKIFVPTSNKYNVSKVKNGYYLVTVML